MSEQDFATERIFAARRDGSGLTRLLRCRAGQQTVENPFDLTGDLLVYDRNPCDEKARLLLRDLAAGTSRAIGLVPGTGPVSDVAVAGGFVASVHAGRVQLHDAASGAELFSAPLPAGTLHGIDVAKDGRLAVSVGSQRTGLRSCWRSRLWLRAPGGSGLVLQQGRPCWDAKLAGTAPPTWPASGARAGSSC